MQEQRLGYTKSNMGAAERGVHGLCWGIHQGYSAKWFFLIKYESGLLYILYMYNLFIGLVLRYEPVLIRPSRPNVGVMR
jgi:hypothetical protein